MEFLGKTYDTGTIVYWCVTILCLGTLAFLLLQGYVTRFRSGLTKGKIHHILRKAGALRQWKILQNVTVSFQGESARLDHAAIGPWGILLFRDLYEKGFYYGKMEEEQWARTDGEEEKSVNRILVLNPGVECEKAVSILRRLFAQDGIYNMQVEWFIPVTGKHVRSYISGGKNVVVTAGELREILSRSRYDKDNGVDIPRVSAFFQH